MLLKCVNTGSQNGNCYILENDKEALILDAGVRYKDVLKALDYNISKVTGLLLTHEHGDHVKSFKDFVRSGMPVRVPVDPETLCQYICMNDKNGNWIWENDIVSINTYIYMEPEEDYFGKIVYVEGWGCWCIQQPGEEKPIPLCECEESYFTERVVEGNIFDSPGMMKEE